MSKLSRAKRACEAMLAVFFGLLALPLLFALAVLVKATSTGPVLHWSQRVGKNNKIFLMPKLRSMRIDTPQLATHLLAAPLSHLTPIGAFLRRTSFDELPQLFSVVVGDLSFVGPRPALFNQSDLVALRNSRGIQVLAPGMTGWAQVNGRDELPTQAKVQFDYEYLQRRSLLFDCRILCMTAAKVVLGEGIRH